jgi:hypothetical protein
LAGFGDKHMSSGLMVKKSPPPEGFEGAPVRTVPPRSRFSSARLSAVRASYTTGLHLTIIDLPATLTRDTVIVAEQVWREIDLGVTAVRDRHELLNTHGLGARRGVLLCGPPGTGKSAVSAVIAAETVGEFTVIYVEAKAGEHLLSAVVEEAQRLGGPVLIMRRSPARPAARSARRVGASRQGSAGNPPVPHVGRSLGIARSRAFGSGGECRRSGD